MQIIWIRRGFFPVFFHTSNIYQNYVFLNLVRFLVVDSIKQMTRILHWITKHCKNFLNVKVEDATSHYSALSIVGPASEKVLQRLTQTPLDLKNFPLNTVKVTS